MPVQRACFALLVAGLAGCTSGTNGAAKPKQVGPLQYGVSYTVVGDQYDDADAGRRYQQCVDLPGAEVNGVDTSLPPKRGLRFLGSKAEQRAVDECLNALPDATVTGPFKAPSQ